MDADIIDNGEETSRLTKKFSYLFQQLHNGCFGHFLHFGISIY